MLQFCSNVSKHDFAEIAYIVCTHAIPASTDNLTEANSPAKILERLRNAEKQFRQHSILVALDAEKLELFTFYRKVDVVKDQRMILSKFGYVCRLNSCKIANKSAARILDLLKPESSRIYKLFTSAVLSSVQILPKINEAAISVGTRVHLVPTAADEHTLQTGNDTAYCPEWQLHRINVQIVASGQLVLTVQNARNARLHRLSDLDKERDIQSLYSGSLLYLIPTGQIARYSGGVVGTKEEIAERIGVAAASAQVDLRSAMVQIPATTQWLRQKHPLHMADLKEDMCWIQIEVALLEIRDGDVAASDKSVVWKPLMWPSRLAFVFRKSGHLHTPTKRNAAETDPLRFALDWYNGSAERNSQLARAQSSKDQRESTDDDSVFVEDNHFEDQYTPQIFNAPAFSANQMIYPTPPEAAIAHQTPGMSSIDGLAPTPAPAFNLSQPEPEPFFEPEMLNTGEQQPNRVGAGFYHEDEDLFEEMPDDKLAVGADADEPNWDFFDPPSLGPSINADGKDVRLDGSYRPPIGNASTPVNGHETANEEFPVIEPSTMYREDGVLMQDVHFTDSSPAKLDSVYGNELVLSPAMVHQQSSVGEPLSISSERRSVLGASEEPASLYVFGSPPLDPRTTRRRSSVFEGVSLTTKSAGHDLRYHKHGKFWFDNDAASKALPSTRIDDQMRRSSSDSDTSMSSSISNSNSSSPVNTQELPVTKRVWTEYKPESPPEAQNQNGDLDHKKVVSETEDILAIIDTATAEDPFLVQIEPLVVSRRQPNYSAAKSLMIAQILVDQVSQSSLCREEPSMQLHCDDTSALVNISMDHSGGRTPVGHATLAELTSIPPRSNIRIFPLGSRLVCVQRADAKIMARQSILPFWDVLGLQPYSEQKDLVAFCIHPSSSNVGEACDNFLSRLSDTYVSCNLGTHSTGRLAGLTNDGLLAWTPQSTPGPNLKQVCQRLGAAIGGHSLPADSMVVVYAISPSRDLPCYREICHAFTVLFEAFVDTSEGVRRNIELVLQIVPLDFVASPDTLVVPNQARYIELALEVYNRIPVREPAMAIASCGSAVILEKLQLREPFFELNNTVASPLFKDGPCLHLAYSYSVDRRWLVAVWSDERGVVAFTMSYCLSIAKGGNAHPKRDVFRNMWDVSHDVMYRSRVKWRLLIAYTGFYDADDIGEWQHLVSHGGDERKMMSKLMLLSIDLNPDISIEIPNATVKSMPQLITSHGLNVSGTPVSTPQAITTSPEQIIAATPTSGTMAHTNVATPPEQSMDPGPDTEITLVDPTDQSWSVLLAYGLNQSSHFLEVRPAAASGVLVKRTGSKEEGKSLRLLGINLVATIRPQPTSLSLSERESMLQEVMEQYRGLATLANSRGCVNKNNDCVPWHIATAVKGSRVLSEAM